MIIMDVKVDNLYAFKNFHINMSYPKKIVDSAIEHEYLEERSNFRYKKVNIIMGGNASGKTSFGKVLMLFANYFSDGIYKRFTNIINDNAKAAGLMVDFVTKANFLYRFDMKVKPMSGDAYKEDDVKIEIYQTPINEKDNYETCALRLDNLKGVLVNYESINTRGWHFNYPQDVLNEKEKNHISLCGNEKYRNILEQTLKTLDPAIQEVIEVKEVEDTYAIKYENQTVLIQKGEILNDKILSSGTKAGVDIAFVLTSLACNLQDFYYIDEKFSFVNSDVEKACLSIMISKLIDRKQLFFTTHNTEILDMGLPKHAYTFLKKDMNDTEQPIKCINASHYLKRNTDSLKHAVANDLFCTAPELHRLYEIAEL